MNNRNEFEFGEYEEFIFVRTYARWLEDQGRRESFDESVERYKNFFEKRAEPIKEEFEEAVDQFKSLEIVPSMRAFFTAGPALERDNIAGYNCCALIIDNMSRFSELLYILLNGTGVGFSVERQFVRELPEIPNKFEDAEDTIIFDDSKGGWARGYREFIEELYKGIVPKYDLSKIRKKGERLKTFGGKSAGKEPLDLLLKQTQRIFEKARGRRLNSLECHDIACYIASSVVVGGVRRSACMSLSNLSDERMRHAKDGEFWMNNPQRALSNNSVAYTERPDISFFLNEWVSLMKSGAGERGIFNRAACEKISKKNKRKHCDKFVTNPCSEIILRPQQFCNLSEVVIRPKDTLEELKEKVKGAVAIGCLQATLTDFKFISDEYKENCEEERLLGVSLTGLRDHEILKSVNPQSRKMLKEMKKHAVSCAKEFSEKLGINMPAAVTAVKPSGTVSQMVNSSSGIHARYSPYYIRRVRVTTSDSLCKFLISKGVQHHPEVGEDYDTANTMVFDFPIESPKMCVSNRDVTALEQLEYWKMLQTCWCSHKPSCTVFIDEDEWIEVGAWVYRNWDLISGISFLPKADSIYQLPPYEEITQQEYNKLKKNMPSIDFNELAAYELEDNTIGAQEFACSGSGGCEIV